MLVPLLMAVTLSLVADGAMGAKAVALLGVLAATAAALRALGAGIAGLEPIWIVIVLGGYALGAGFGFVLGAVCILASALLTGGVGPWMPFQMIAAAWVGPRCRDAGRTPARAGRDPRPGGLLLAGGRGLRVAAEPLVLADGHRTARGPLLRRGRRGAGQRRALVPVQPDHLVGLRPAPRRPDLHRRPAAREPGAGGTAPHQQDRRLRRPTRVRPGPVVGATVAGDPEPIH